MLLYTYKHSISFINKFRIPIGVIPVVLAKNIYRIPHILFFLKIFRALKLYIVLCEICNFLLDNFYFK